MPYNIKVDRSSGKISVSPLPVEVWAYDICLIFISLFSLFLINLELIPQNAYHTLYKHEEISGKSTL